MEGPLGGVNNLSPSYRKDCWVTPEPFGSGRLLTIRPGISSFPLSLSAVILFDRRQGKEERGNGAPSTTSPKTLPTTDSQFQELEPNGSLSVVSKVLGLEGG